MLNQAGFYAENIANVAAYRAKEADGTILIALSVKAISVLPIIDARNDYGFSSTISTSTITAIYVAFSGLFVLRALEAEEFPAGMDVCITSEAITICEMVCQLADSESHVDVSLHPVL
jgi:hypothetical protein